MIEHLRKPPPPFADLIRRHFWLKRDEICLQVTEWIRETREMVTKYPASKQLLGHQALMEKNFEVSYQFEFN
jgi:baculoviral IAP repeat-containing protein 6